jgi:hypothetical protein
MDNDRDVDWSTRLHFQSRVTTRRQALDHGVPEGIIDRRLASGAWLRLYRGAYATFSGEPPREARLWAALLRAGPGAVLSHETAAEIQELADRPSSRIHITVPIERNPARAGEIPGVIIHRSRRVVPDPQPDWQLPRTQIEDTVLDLAATAKNFDDAYSWISRATGRRLTTAGSLREALGCRKKIRWRAWLADALADAAEGINSALERRYVNGVERAHGLPSARRQARRAGTKVRYLDNHYEAYGLCVELDGQASHPPEQRWQDASRDNANLVTGDIRTLRYGWVDATVRRCGTAVEVAAVLGRLGWAQDTLRPCGPDCSVSGGG